MSGAIRRARVALGTLFDIAIDQFDGDGGLLIEECFSLIDRLERSLSRFDPRSELRSVCLRAHREPVGISRAFADVLSLALELHAHSGGAFEVAWRRSRGRLASGGSEYIDLKSGAEIDAAAGPGERNEGRPGERTAACHTAAHVRFRRRLQLDFDGIAKGYIVDRVVDWLELRGVRAARVNAGGDLRVLGEQDEPIWLRFNDGFRLIGRLRSGAFAASLASRHRDPRGRPVASQSVIAAYAPCAAVADAMTKVGSLAPSLMDGIALQWRAEWRTYAAEPRARAAQGARAGA